VIEPASLIGFGLVFMGVSWTASVVLCGAVLLARSVLKRLGPCAERRAAAWSVTLPPVFGLYLVGALVTDSAAGLWLGDHCPQHAHHLHLCLYHGAEWATLPWAVATMLFVTAVFVSRATQQVGHYWTACAALQRLISVARSIAAGDCADVLIVPADAPFCFVGGVFRPRIFVSSSAWERLDDKERRAVVEHERAHVEQGDLWRRSVLGFLSLFGVPVLSAKVLALWNHATERLCDRRAACGLEEPTAIARALLNLARAGKVSAVSPTVSFIGTCDVAERVEAVLEGGPDGAAAARWLGAAVALLAAPSFLLSALLADPLHHAIETILGMI
jgi:Zn-dependent protease with chaperone function